VRIAVRPHINTQTSERRQCHSEYDLKPSTKSQKSTVLATLDLRVSSISKVLVFK
jgi:hypothetical protein